MRMSLHTFEIARSMKTAVQNDIHKTNATSAHARRFSRANNVMNIYTMLLW